MMFWYLQPCQTALKQVRRAACVVKSKNTKILLASMHFLYTRKKLVIIKPRLKRIIRMKKQNPEKKSKQPNNRLREFSIEAPRIVFSSMLIASFTSLFGGQAYAETSYNRLSSLLASVPE